MKEESDAQAAGECAARHAAARRVQEELQEYRRVACLLRFRDCLPGGPVGYGRAWAAACAVVASPSPGVPRPFSEEQCGRRERSALRWKPFSSDSCARHLQHVFHETRNCRYPGSIKV